MCHPLKTTMTLSPVLYRSTDDKLPDFSKEGSGAGGEVYFDPNVLSEDGSAALAATAFSRDGKYYAYGISLSASTLPLVIHFTTDSHARRRVATSARYMFVRPANPLLLSMESVWTTTRAVSLRRSDL
jgi:hypothetical protein